MSVIIEQNKMAGPPDSPTLSTWRRNRLIIDAAAVVVGLGLGGCIALAISGETRRALAAPGGWTTFLGRLFGLTGTYLLLIMVLLVARIPFVERAVGQDRLVRWHRNLGQWPVYLLVLHAVLITFGYAQEFHSGVLHQAWLFVRTYPDVLMAVVALVLVVTAAIASIRAARRRMRYETWWTIHLYLYLALAFSVAHQIANGQAFIGHPLTRYIWAAFWAATAGTALVFRVLLPVGRTLYHGLRVQSIKEESPGVVSVVCSGRHLDRLGVAGGQFFQWRFLCRGMWWQAHPYSLSAMPRPPYIRFTAKAVGDYSKALRRLPIGTRVAIEGPYGAFTEEALVADKVLLIGAGVGITPIRALLEDLEAEVDVVVVTRASRPKDLVLDSEIRTLVSARGGRLHELIGSREKFPLHARHLKKLVPDIGQRDVYVCGPDGLSATVTGAARDLGIPEERIHCEQFAF